MNVANVTEELMDAYVRLYGKEYSHKVVQRDAQAIPKVPMLTYDFGNESDNQFRQRVNDSFQNLETVPKTPFDSFRYWMRFSHSTFYGICGRYSDREIICFGVGISRRSNQKFIMRVNLSPPSRPGEIGFKARIWNSDFVEINFEKLQPENRTMLDCFTGTLSLGIEQLSYEYLRPDQHVATVTPDKAGKSVEWIRARTHYTIVHRKHAANSKDVLKGSVVRQDENRHIQRIAHTRRAHWRTFRSERFKKVRGERRFIKSSWVGPEEWRNEAGQIYRIASIRPESN